MFKVSLASLQKFIDTRLTLAPSVILNSNYIIILIETAEDIVVFFLYCNHQVHRDFLITL
jgi:hypothetical protein